MNYDHNKNIGQFKVQSGYRKFYLNSPTGYSPKKINAHRLKGRQVFSAYPGDLVPVREAVEVTHAGVLVRKVATRPHLARRDRLTQVLHHTQTLPRLNLNLLDQTPATQS